MTLSLGERRSRPHWVYRLFDANGVLLYVGQTFNPVSRFANWCLKLFPGSTHWFGEVARVDWRLYPDWYAATTAEKHAIEAERPQHNVHHQPKLVAA